MHYAQKQSATKQTIERETSSSLRMRVQFKRSCASGCCRNRKAQEFEDATRRGSNKRPVFVSGRTTVDRVEVETHGNGNI